MTTAISLRDEYIQRAIKIARVSDHEALKVAAGLKEVHNKILKRIASEYGELNSAKLKELNKVIVDLVVDHYRENVNMSVEEFAREVTQREIEWARKVMIERTAKRLVKPILSAAIDAAAGTAFQGSTFGTWFEQAGVSNVNRIVKSLNNAWLQGMSPAEAVRQVFTATQRSEADIKTLTRSYMAHLSIHAREQSLEPYKDLIGGYVWDSILDNRTTPEICGIRDQLAYDTDGNPIGHDLPWMNGPGRAHFNCRSNAIPFLKGECSMSSMAAQASPSAASFAGTVCNVKARGSVRPASSSQLTGIETVAPGVGRRL